ncbi:helix-turn-helix transcriptional regulator [uncultured Lamprocystis sp.]|jgi:transcriptional regulator with XRE-family HTH domain|uniref:helix-turn-helix domain-containing protein n=1 Tax=uncultured Lamprocystis sp. TaxID=543132 RepID=UPI0025EC1595|nr:helix-turn-helix transcriptional regulator [uncultured Lamprocystis sp.]
MSLGQNIRRIRQAKGWTQGQLSEHTGIKIGHLSKLEQDEGDPKASTLYKLIQAFGCTPTGLMSDPDQSREGTEADALLSMIFERVDNLPDKAKMSLVEVLDRFCMGWEMELAITQTPRKWNALLQPQEQERPL